MTTHIKETLSTIIQSIAASFPDPADQARYLAAARNFRVPYWDWAMPLQAGDSVLPSSVQEETVKVMTPSSDGQAVEMKNPLYSFDFHPLNPTAGDFPLKDVSRDAWLVVWRIAPISKISPLKHAEDLHTHSSPRPSNKPP